MEMPNLKIAVALHLYYDELWPELSSSIGNIGHDYELFVTIPEFSAVEELVLRDFPAAHIARVPNVGRDVAPFIILLPELQRFDLVCKVHSKRNIDGDGAWRDALLRGVLGSPRLVASILRAFCDYPHLALAGAELLYLDGHLNTFGSGPMMEKYFGILPARYGFFGGTMFWTRPKLFADFPEIFPIYSES